ncbi:MULTISPECIES: ABC transporter permease [unclassified Beijerinckia]|uniref:ABC transporter permease n=1 Tax=unclassified Beijerinckia TaxID=2638183 RepID=UPI0008978567|nr:MULTISPECIES: ABC transporter permease [unclassified Beijerinckia]MDH7799054.1 ABC-type nitrate/sulfonate/bicarbonate transport system permease component [Beijerinckia sp. GAS462]SED96580.1 NitT/TauT family transport system permease protein [Beijerinckia sp. 28-YEA-48]
MSISNQVVREPWITLPVAPDATSFKSGRERYIERVTSIVTPLALLALWEMCGRMGWLDQRFFPAPSSVLGTFRHLLMDVPYDESLLAQISASLTRAAIGFVIGAIPGVVVGCLMGLNRLVNAAVQPLIGALLPIPKVAILPLLMLMFGLGEESKWAIIAVGVFFQVVVATATGVANIDRIYLDVGTNFGASRLATFFTIALPGALPNIFSGLRLGWGIALLLLVTAEMFSSKSGLGYLIWQSWQTLSVEDMYVGLITIAVLGIVSFALIDVAERKLIPWKRK